MYRNFFRIQKKFGHNRLVKNRPLVIALMVVGLSVITGNWRAVKRIYHALNDGLADDFPINPNYIP